MLALNGGNFTPFRPPRPSFLANAQLQGTPLPPVLVLLLATSIHTKSPPSLGNVHP